MERPRRAREVGVDVGVECPGTLGVIGGIPI
jgi:hypothetical protein